MSIREPGKDTIYFSRWTITNPALPEAGEFENGRPNLLKAP